MLRKRKLTSVVHVGSQQNQPPEYYISPDETQDCQEIVHRVHETQFQVRVLSFEVNVLEERIGLQQDDRALQEHPNNLFGAKECRILVDCLSIFLQVHHSQESDDGNDDGYQSIGAVENETEDDESLEIGRVLSILDLHDADDEEQTDSDGEGEC